MNCRLQSMRGLVASRILVVKLRYELSNKVVGRMGVF